MSLTPTKQQKSLPALTVELKDLVVTYAKEQTVEPVKGLARFLVWGLAGSAVLALGLVLLVLSLLRVLQTELDTVFDGNLSFLPYVITLVVCVVVLALAARAVGAAKRRRGGA